MIELIKACLVINIVGLFILLCLVITMCVFHIKREKAHKKEKTDLQNIRDFHIKELKKRAGYSTEEVGYELGERGDKR